MKELFHIGKKNADDKQQLLSMQFGLNHGCFAISDFTGDRLYELVYCKTNEWASDEVAAVLNLYSFFSDNYFKIKIAYDFPQSSITPGLINETVIYPDLIKTTFGINIGSVILAEKIADLQINNIYQVPEDLHEALKNKFPTANYWHQNSLLLKRLPYAGQEGCMMINFKTEDFSVILFQNNKVLLVQSYEYETPQDVLFYLIKLVQQFSLSQTDVKIMLSGLVDKDSSLFKELYQYFIHIDCREAVWKIPGSEYPLHFFTSINDLAQCEL